MTPQSWPCFMITPTGQSWRWLRRYTYSGCDKYGHDAETFLDIAPSDRAPDRREAVLRAFPPDDPRWPTTCRRCGVALATDAEYQIFTLEIYISGSNETFSIHGNAQEPAQKAPTGATWFADWLLPWNAGPDGHCLVVRCPGDHDWTVDGRASNCDHPCVNCGRAYKDHFTAAGYTADGCNGGYQPRDEGAHRCWVRHGEPPNVTVDKNGLTCGAGAGSIQVPGWHGFLQNGVLHP